MQPLCAAEIVRLDKEAIYIGNTYTIEADLALPLTGANGSHITWQSNKPYLVSHEGTVSRPHAGSGNREALLTATLTYADVSETREFQLTILQLPLDFKITKLHPVQVYVQENETPVYPGVVVAENEKGQYAMLPVEWHGEEGHVEGTDLKASVTRIPAAEPLRQKPTPKAQKFEKAQTILLPGSLFYENQERGIGYLLSLHDDEMLYNFREASGLDTQGAKPLLGWDAPECKLKGHTTGHYLSALALACVSGSPHAAKCREKLIYMIDELAKCQEALHTQKGCQYGFISAYSEEQFDLLEEYTKYPIIWAPYYTLHKILAGLLDAYRMADIKAALSIAEKTGTWLYNRLSRLPSEQRSKMWSMYIAGEYGGINESLATLYALTGNESFLTAANYFDNEKLFYPMAHGFDALGGLHANQHIPQIVGVMELFNQTNVKQYYIIAKNFWDFVTGAHIYNIGGTGEGEMFRAAGEIKRYLSDKNAETCASYNMLKLTEMLFCHEPHAQYMDYYEKALYNHIAASQDQKGSVGGSTYFMPLAPGSKKDFDDDANSCCHGTGMENHIKYSKTIYAKSADSLYVNLYIPSTVQWAEKNVTLTQTGDYLQQQAVAFKIAGNAEFKLMLRIPQWLDHYTLYVNDVKQQACPTENGYICLHQKWEDNTVIRLETPFQFRIEPAPDDTEFFSIYYGPLVMVAVHESLSFIPLPVNGVDLNAAMKPTEKPLCFTYNGLTFISNYNANHCAYHAYFQHAPSPSL